jgi:hypothetical protein
LLYVNVMLHGRERPCAMIANPAIPTAATLYGCSTGVARRETPMPHGKKKLSTCDRTAIRPWIREGAKNN